MQLAERSSVPWIHPEGDVRDLQRQIHDLDRKLDNYIHEEYIRRQGEETRRLRAESDLWLTLMIGANVGLGAVVWIAVLIKVL